jgi:mannose-1-phosphate guanylyltransferase
LVQTGTVVADDALLIGGTSVGSGCTIEAGALLDDCIIGDNVVIGAGAQLIECFVTHGTNVPSNVEKSQKYLSPSGELPISL